MISEKLQEQTTNIKPRLYREPGITVNQAAQKLKEKYANAGNFVMVNVKLEKRIGLGPARILAQIINDYAYYGQERSLTADGFYYCTINTLFECTGFKGNKQIDCLKILLDLNLIIIDYREQRKRYIKPIEENIIKFLAALD